MLSRDCKRSWHGPWHVESVLQGPWLSHVARRSVGPALALAAEPLQWDCRAMRGTDRMPKRQNAGGTQCGAIRCMQWGVSCSNAMGFTNCCCMQWDCGAMRGWQVHAWHHCAGSVGCTNIMSIDRLLLSLSRIIAINGPRVSCHRRGSAPPREAGLEHDIIAYIITF